MTHRPHDDADPLPSDPPSARTLKLRATVRQLTAAPCGECGHQLCGHEAVLAVALGHQHAPRCAVCLASELDEATDDLCERALQWIRRRECYLTCWDEASTAERQDQDRPTCLFGRGAAIAAVATPTAATAAPPARPAEASFDAGELACGDLVLELRFRMLDLKPGAVLKVTARDPAAPIDLPAWCGLCGHLLLHATHPDYWIQRKRD